MSVIEKEDWKSITDLVTNAKEVVSSVQDVARKLADYTNFRGNKSLAGKPFCCTGSKLNCLWKSGPRFYSDSIFSLPSLLGEVLFLLLLVPIFWQNCISTPSHW